jgi:hypothetical protein
LANDPKELKAIIAQLRKELASKTFAAAAIPPATKTIVEEKIVEVPVLRDDQVAELRQAIKEVSAVSSILASALDRAQKRPAPAAQRPPTPMPARSSTPAPAIPQAENNGDFTRPQMQLIQALGEAEAIGRAQISRSWLASIARVSAGSSSFEKNVSRLSAAGMICYPSGGRVALTDAGRALVEPIQAPLTTESLLDRVCSTISRPQGVLLRTLHGEYPNSLTRAELAARASVSEGSSSFEKNVSALSGRELVEYPTKGEVKCAQWLFIDDQAVA